MTDKEAARKAQLLWGKSAAVTIYPNQKLSHVVGMTVFGCMWVKGAGASWEEAFEEAYKRFEKDTKETLKGVRGHA